MSGCQDVRSYKFGGDVEKLEQEGGAEARRRVKGIEIDPERM